MTRRRGPEECTARLQARAIRTSAGVEPIAAEITRERVSMEAVWSFEADAAIRALA